MKNFHSKTLTLAFTIYISAMGLAQVPNDNCDGAVSLPGLDDIEVVFCSDNIWNNISVVLENASPEPNVENCALSEVPGVWYKIPAQPDNFFLILSVLGSPNTAPVLKLFAGSCDDLSAISGCYEGDFGQLSLTPTFLVKNREYYILVGDQSASEEPLELQYYTRGFFTSCLFESNLEPVYRSGDGEVFGPYEPGDTVGFEYTTTFQVTTGPQNCQWFQGLVPVFGEGWSLASFGADGEPLNSTMNGNSFPAPNVENEGLWDWWDNVTYHHETCLFNVGDFDGNGTLDMCNTSADPNCIGSGLQGGCCGPCWDDEPGDILPPGWFTSGNTGSCQIDGYPTVDWGDGNTCNGLTGPWSFYFELIVSAEACNIENYESFSIAMHGFADGEVGSWTGGLSVCANDMPQKYYAPVKCCSPTVANSFLSGRVYVDFDQDCTYSGTEPGMPYTLVEIVNQENGDSRFVLSNSGGAYITKLDTGNYWVIPHYDQFSPVNCPDTLEVYLSELCTDYVVNFANDNENLCVDEPYLSISSLWLSPCLSAPVFVNFSNNGVIPIDSVDLQIELGEYLDFIDMDVPYTQIDDQNFFVSLYDIDVNENIIIRIDATTSCEAPLDSVSCSNVTVVSDICNGIMLSASDCSPVIGPFDPNMKVDASNGLLSTTKITGEESIEYDIHFQNTGNAPANNVSVLDTLPAELDISTFEFLSSSHSVEVEIVNNKVLKFTFDMINLPDSISDEMASHGLVTYSIKPIQGLEDGVKIRNSASIYFDFNAPVKTNTKEHIVTCPTGENEEIYIEEGLCTGESIELYNIIFDENNLFGSVVLPNANPDACDSLVFISILFYPEITLDSASITSDLGQGTGSIELHPPAGSFYQYEWDNGSTESTVTGLTAGDYTVTISDQNGCAESYTYTVELASGSRDFPADPVLNIYPVPVQTTIIIEIVPGTNIKRIDVLDVTGKPVLTQVPTWPVKVDVSILKPAFYFIRLETEDGVFVRKIVKM